VTFGLPSEWLALGLDQRFQHQEELFGQHWRRPILGIPIVRSYRAKVSGRLRGSAKMVSSLG
jgi:hypothetical protein